MRILLVLLLLLFSCGRDTADTTSSSEVTNGFTALILDGKGEPAGACTVSIVERGAWYNNLELGLPLLIDQKVTSQTGELLFDSLPEGRYSLIAKTDTDGEKRNITLIKDTDHFVETLYIDSLSTISGRVTALTGEVTRVALQGTTIETDVASDGSFSFERVPGRSAEIVALIDTVSEFRTPAFGAGFTLTPGVNLDVQQVQSEVDAILLDDFNDGNKESIFGWLTGHGLWYTYVDSSKKGNSQIIPATALDDPSTAISSDGAYQGKAMHLSFIMGDAISTPHASLACQLRDEFMSYANLKDLTKMSCRVKGRGKIRINFISHAIDSYEPTDIRGDFGVTVDLTDEWRELVIEMDTLLPEPESQALKDSLTWSDVSDSVRSIVWGSWSNTPGDTIELFLDNVILYGLDPALFEDE